MPKRAPKYALHKPSGQARVRIDGKNHYLGVYDSPESHERYEQLVARWLGGTLNADRESLSIARLGILYIDHCRACYVKEGKQTSEVLATQACFETFDLTIRQRKSFSLRAQKAEARSRSVHCQRGRKIDDQLSHTTDRQDVQMGGRK